MERLRFLILLLLLFKVSNCIADGNPPTNNEPAANKDNPQQVQVQIQDSKPEEVKEGKSDDAKQNKCDAQPANEENKPPNVKVEEPVDSLKVADSNRPAENVGGGNAHEVLDGKNAEAVKNEPHPSLEKGEKSQNSKDENNHKTDLNDVNCLDSAEEDDESGMEKEKREADEGYEGRSQGQQQVYLGRPRDASYFFEDLEPFVGDNRVGRSAPDKESKLQKSKITKGDPLEAEEMDDDEELHSEEAEEDRQNEDDYDDDDMDECQPTTTPCTTKSPCTTKCTPSTTPCPPTTKKCTTPVQCTTKCTPPTTKCPRLCPKSARRQSKTSSNDDDSIAALDLGVKKLKRRNHEKITS